ncbi:cytochrome P450 [Streptomyces sp. NPDC048279]|uniref:cytochrome P450 family protein n=1 Tax=Streptomyces sp. NPDC048279 TaxID=3154714 RepID=UPI0034342028
MTTTAITGQEIFSYDTDLHAVYRTLRREGPVRPVELPTGKTGWLVTRYADVKQALAETQLSKGGMISPVGFAEISGAARANLTRHMLTVDPPDHTRLRRLISSAFTTGRVDKLRPRIERIADELLDNLTGREEIDVVNEFAFSLALTVICELIGVPIADREKFRTWSNTIVAGIGARDQLADAMTSMLGYLQDLIEQKRREPADDLVSALIKAGEEGDKLTPEEVSSTIFLLLIAGHETTVNLIGNGVLLLLSEPAVWATLRAEPDHLPAAIEEILRFETPVHLASYRVAKEEVEIGGQTIPAGAPVLVSVLSANRDEATFPGADRFDIHRTSNPHVAFGYGIHYCLGAPLARLEGEVALGRLMSRYPHMSLAQSSETVGWRPSPLIHGLKSLRVNLT